MTTVLIVACLVPRQPTILVEALWRMRAQGATVNVACDFDASALGVEPTLADVHTFGVQDGGRLRGTDLSRDTWRRAWDSAWVRERARRADLLVALDANAVYTVWELAHRNGRAQVRFGLAPAVSAVTMPARPSSAWVRLGRRTRSAVGVALRGARRWSRGVRRRATPPIRRALRKILK